MNDYLHVKKSTRSFSYLAQKSNPSGSRILKLETLKVLETKSRYTSQVIGIDKGFLNRTLGVQEIGQQSTMEPYEIKKHRKGNC